MSDRAASPNPALRVAIIGGGTAGLATALSLKERIPAPLLELSIFEASDVLGGNNQSFDGVPLYFSCFNQHNATVLLEYMKKLGLKATTCNFLSLSLKDKSGGGQRNHVEEVSMSMTKSTSKDFSNDQDDWDNQSKASTASTDVSSSTAIADKSPTGPVVEFRTAKADRALTTLFTLYQEHSLSSRFRSLLPSPDFWHNLLLSNITAEDSGYTMCKLAAAINYFYSSRDPGFSEKHVSEYYRKNCGTYYWSIEHGRNDLLIERMRDRLMEVPSEGIGRKKQSKALCLCGSVDVEEFSDLGPCSSMEDEGGKVAIHCGVRCTSVEPLPDGTVRLQYEPSSMSVESPESDSDRASQDTSSQDGEWESSETAIFDHVIICVAPHVASQILKNCSPLQSFFGQCPFRPVRAHSIVHTDRSVKCSSSANSGPTALTYEIGEDGSWVLHIDCAEYYGIRTNNIVSICYAPDTINSIDPKFIKGRFSTTLSKSRLHDQGSEQVVESLRRNLQEHHQEANSNVYLCGSYYCYEQWSQDAFAMAVEVADCVVKKFEQGKHLKFRQAAMLDKGVKGLISL